MSKSIDERVVSMAFENRVFEQRAAQTLATLQKLDDSLAKAGKHNGLAQIEQAANKVTLNQPMSAFEKLKSKLHFGKEAQQGFGEIEKASSRVSLSGAGDALVKFAGKLTGIGTHASESFSQIEQASNKVQLNGPASAVDGMIAKFGALEVAAIAAFSTIVSKATLGASATAKGLTVGPVISGYKEYELKLNSIQTILANTKASGATLKDVTSALDELNHYADQTIYNFGQMAKNIGTFTAAGVDLDTATASIKGIANLAALSGTNSEQASRAMYQLSQAISSGRVSLMDWKSVENAGMGGAVFQRNLAETAVAMGVLDKSALKLTGKMKNVTINGESFRSSIMAKPGQQSWLDSKVLTASLSTFTGDMKDAELAAMGFSAEQIKAIQAQAQTAVEAATKVKTFTQLMDTTKESIESGWAETWEIVFGDFEEARKTWSSVAKVIGGFVQKTSDARKAMLSDWDKLGGRKELIDGVANAFDALFSVIGTVGKAFRDIFPRKTGEELFQMTKNFAAFTKGLKPSAEVLDGLRRTLRGVFAVMHIGWEVAKGVVGVLADLVGVVGGGSGSFLNFTGSIGDLLVALDSALTKGGLLKGWFDNVSDFLAIPLKLFMELASAVTGMFGAEANPAIAKGIHEVGEAAGPVTQALDGLKKAWDKLVDIFREAKDFVSPWLEKIGDQMSHLGDLLANAFETANFDKVMSFIQTGFIGAVLLSLKKAIDKFDGLAPAFEGINGVLKGLTGNLQAMQKNLQARTLQAIATAIGILAASIWVLSKIDADDLSKSMTTIAIGFGQLVAAMALLGSVMKGQGKLGLLAMPVISASMIALAGAVVLLSGAIKIFSTMDWDELARGLTGLGGGLAIIAAATKLMGPLLVPQAIAIGIFAVGLNILALAVRQFASLSWEELGRGLAGVLFSLVALISPLTALGPLVVPASLGLIGIAFAMNMLAGALTRFSEIDPGKMAVGLGGLIGALAAIGLAIQFTPPLLIAQAGALILMGVALQGIAKAIGMMGDIGIEKLIVGLTGMAGALAILAIGLTAMSVGQAGTLALLGAAAAFAVLAPAMALMGKIGIKGIVVALVGMAGALGVLAIAGTVAAPGLLALGFALIPLAKVLLLAGVAALLFGKGLSLMGTDGAKGVGVMLAALGAFIAILPKLIISLVQGFVETIGEVAKLAPKVAEAIFKIVDQIIQVIIASTPRLAVALGVMIDSFVVVVGQNAPKIIAAGWKLLMDFLGGITQNLPQLIVTAGTIITQFLSGLAAQLPNIIAAGAKLIAAYLTGLASQAGRLVTAAVTLVGGFIVAVAQQAGRLVSIGAQAMVGFIGSISSKAGEVLSAGVGVILHFLSGIGQAIPRIARKGLDVASKFVHAVANGVVQLADVAAQGVINFMNGLAAVIDKRAPEMRKAGRNLARAIMEGMVGGLKDLAHLPVDAVKGIGGSMIDGLKKKFDSHSPSRVFQEIGQFVMVGLANGLDNSAPEKTMVAQGKRLVDTAKNTLNAIPNALDGVMDADPVISPVLDLSAVEKEAKRLNGMTEVSPLKPLTSLEHAAAIADVASAAPTVPDTVPTVIRETKLEQTINSPDPISPVEVYRHTKNLLSAATEGPGSVS